MTFEVAISTMNKTYDEIFEMLKSENIHCNCLVINQCDKNDYYSTSIGNSCVRIICTDERGLARSRNMAIANCKSDILLIGDDDLIYYDGFDKTITETYEKNPNVDVALFNIDTYDRIFSLKESKIPYPLISHFTSQQYSFRVSAIKQKNISFNPQFGAGSRIVQFGEENLFLADCYKKRLQIRYFPQKILKNEDCIDSSWFKGMNNKEYIRDKGVVCYAIYGKFFFVYILRFLIKQHKNIKPFSMLQAFVIAWSGKDFYKELQK